MASASTPAMLLPVTNPVVGGASALTSGSMLSDTSPAFRLFVSRLSETA
jgi:PRA1 family protein 1